MSTTYKHILENQITSSLTLACKGKHVQLGVNGLSWKHKKPNYVIEKAEFAFTEVPLVSQDKYGFEYVENDTIRGYSLTLRLVGLGVKKTKKIVYDVSIDDVCEYGHLEN